MNRFIIFTATAALSLGSTSFAIAIAGDDSGDQAQQMLSATEVQNLLTSKGYSQVNSVQTGNPDGRVRANATRNGKPMNVKIDLNTGGVIETSR